MASPIKNNPFDADHHLKYFAEFTRAVEFAGGTTPHMLMVAESANRQKDFQEKLWWAGCYAFVYNYATAEIIRNTWRPGAWKYDELVTWARDNWKGIKFRKERKAARSPERLATCMDTYFQYMITVENREWFVNDTLSSTARYNAAFDDICNEVKYMGRYIAIRWIEVIRRVFNLAMEMPDLRPRDGDHPRKALALMYPEYHDELMGGNSDSEIAVTNDVVEFCKQDMKELYGVSTDYYTMQSLLCEYKQSCLGRKQYPGKSIDTELVYFDKICNDWWGDRLRDNTIMFDVRKTIFPECMLGELQGWTGVRNELGNVLADYGYTWSDYIYDYIKTTDFSSPVYRSNRRTIL
jgi:hypothetical protein